MMADGLPAPITVRHVPIGTNFDGSYNFIALTPPVPTTAIQRVNVRAYVECFMEEFDFQFWYQTSDDLQTWTDASGPMGGSTYSHSTPGLEDSWVDLTESGGFDDLYVRFGVRTKDPVTGDNATGMFLLTMMLQFQAW